MMQNEQIIIKIMQTIQHFSHTLSRASRMNGGMDSDLDAGGMFGFSNSDVEELACQGIKPWDDEAADALAVLRGDYDDYY